MKSKYIAFTPQRSHLAYGQDFTRVTTERALGITSIEATSAATIDYADVELVIVHDMDHAAVAAAVEMVPAGIPVIGHVHLQWSYLGRRQRETLSRLVSHIRHGIAPAAFLASDFARRSPGADWETIRNGVDESRFRPATADARRAWRRKLGLAEDGVLLAYVGRLETAKGTQILQALARNLSGSEYHLLIQYPAWAGIAERYDPLAQAIQAACPARVHLLPDEDPNRDRPIRYCDCLVHPSLSEVAPRTVVESWMSGVPVVATDCTPFYGEVPELDGATALVELPSELETNVRDRAQLRVDNVATANQIAIDLLSKMLRVFTGDDQRREKIAEQAQRCGFGSAQMLRSLSASYERIARRC